MFACNIYIDRYMGLELQFAKNLNNCRKTEKRRTKQPTIFPAFNSIQDCNIFFL